MYQKEKSQNVSTRAGCEPGTSQLPVKCSATELFRRLNLSLIFSTNQSKVIPTTFLPP